MIDSFNDDDFTPAPNSVEGATQVMQSWGIVGGLKYLEDGSLVLSDRLGQAVCRNDLSEFEETVEKGVSQVLTYQDVADYTAFAGQFNIMGMFPIGSTEVVVIRRKDGATFGTKGNVEGWVFEPVERTESGDYRGVE